ncbi:DNA repair protein rad50 [Dimargaris verticillata]|uniref:DNA repair protein RAD50 n=1 Tax=Dimargaris verticillata TaxID=2761393 RepID=A0A9W8EBS7_9FUNG|nr:DNA repair protein rad50 [Dimargaris verticillata]
MAAIDKLMVRGIRSFNPDEACVIEFYTPLTIIVGHNGSGKTTIIECLKYATTGDLPPNSKGGAFIHDPHLTRTPDTKAQIKLKFTNINKQSLICTRSIQLTQRAKTMSQKTLENLLVRLDPTDPSRHTSLSTRCADLDMEMPLQLGVPKAILQNVIFCHQEESSWPLMEPSVVKKKFDEIFASTRYTKALDSIRSIRKSQNQEIKLDQQSLTHLQEKKVKAEKVRVSHLYVQEKIGQYRQTMASKTQELDQLSSEIQAASRSRDQLQLQRTRHDQLRLERDRMSTSLAQLKNHMIIMSETPEQIRALQAKQAQSERDHEREKKVLHQSITTHAALIQRGQAQTLALHTRKGQLETRVTAHSHDVGRMATLLQTLKERHGLAKISLPTDQLSDEAVVLDRAATAQQCCHDLSHQLSAQKQASRTKATTLAAERQRHEAALAQAMQRQRLLAQKLTDLEAKAVDLGQALSTLTVDTAKESALATTVDATEAKLTELQTLATTAAKDGSVQLASLRTKLAAYDEEADQVNRQMQSLNSMVSQRAKLALQKSDAEKLHAHLQGLETQYMAKMREIELGEFSDHRQAQAAVVQFEEEHTATTANLRDDLSAMQARIVETRAQLQVARSTRDECESRLVLYTQTLADHQLSISQDLLAKVSDAEQTLEKCRDAITELRSTAAAHQVYIAQTEASQCCPLCTRSFSDSKLVDSFIDELRTKALEAPQRLQNLELNYQGHNQILKKLQSVVPAWQDARHLQDVELPRAMQEVTRLETQLASQLATCDRHQEAMHALEPSSAALQALKEIDYEWMGQQAMVERVQHDIAALETELTASGGSTLTVDDCLAQLATIARSKKQVEQAISDHHDQQLAQQTEVQELKLQLLQDQHTLQSLRQQSLETEKLTAQLALCERQIRDTQADQSALTQSIAEHQSQATAAGEQCDRHQEQARATEEQLETELTEFRDTMMAINSVKETLQRYAQDQVAVRLTECKQQIETESAKISESETVVAESQRALDNLSQQLQDFDAYMTKLRDNLQYHEYQARIRALDGQLDSLEAATAIDNQLQQLKTQAEALEQQRLTTSTALAGLEGEIKQLEYQQRQYQQELDTDFKDVERQFTDQLIKCKTTELACSDLDKYGKALDNAIMKYHSLKMEEINKTIHELWINTYQGNDIDVIEIRSDCEASSNTSRSMRSYNYRVIMVKSGVELDMRGRCSAGQRVLACLIIRLALAESFGLNCGILALDEPTTNLDRANIESLAQSLAHIIRVRRLQSNFQLIIITHDEEFMELLGRSDHTDYYWRVSKDIK